MSDEWITKVQNKLFESKEPENPNDWEDMPEFINEDNDAFRKIIVSFTSDEDVKQFAKLLDQTITSKTKSLWFPPKFRSNSLVQWT